MKTSVMKAIALILSADAELLNILAVKAIYNAYICSAVTNRAAPKRSSDFYPATSRIACGGSPLT